MLLIFQVRVEILLDLASVTTIIHDLNLDKDDHDKNVNRFCFGSPYGLPKIVLRMNIV